MVALMALALTACSYDDSELWDKVNDLDNRVKTLEGLCREMNTQYRVVGDYFGVAQQE